MENAGEQDTFPERALIIMEYTQGPKSQQRRHIGIAFQRNEESLG